MFEVIADQGTEGWFSARLGKPTSSRFKDIMTMPKKKTDTWSKKSIDYAMELVAERITGERKEIFGKALDWGKEHEDTALEEYEDLKGCMVTSSGLILNHEYGSYGGSPDGVVYGDIVIVQEVKCPYNSTNHLNTVLDGMPKDHMPQVQGNIYFTEAEAGDFISFDPRIQGSSRLYVQRVPRDQEYIDKMIERVEMFVEYVDEIEKKLK